MGRKKWKSYHFEILRREYPEKGTKIPELRKFFTKSSIKTKASLLNISYKYMKRFEQHK